MAALVQQRCLNHAGREAVARCPVCVQFFCRECITEHDDRVMCSSCLRKLTQSRKKTGPGWNRLGRMTAALGGFLLAWVCLYLIGRTLLTIPSDFHEGPAWTSDVVEE